MSEFEIGELVRFVHILGHTVAGTLISNKNGCCTVKYKVNGEKAFFVLQQSKLIKVFPKKQEATDEFNNIIESTENKWVADKAAYFYATALSAPNFTENMDVPILDAYIYAAQHIWDAVYKETKSEK